MKARAGTPRRASPGGSAVSTGPLAHHGKVALTHQAQMGLRQPQGEFDWGCGCQSERQVVSPGPWALALGRRTGPLAWRATGRLGRLQ